MNCNDITFSRHAIQRMFERCISRDAVVRTLSVGEVINEYPTDQPYPSVLMLDWFDDQPLHLVAAKDALTGQCIVITAYRPSPDQCIWTTKRGSHEVCHL